MAGYTNDMTSLADIVNPAAAAGQAGQQDQATANADALKNQLSAGTLPADIQAAGLKNLFTQAQTAQDSALAQQTELGNIEKAGTLGTGIAAGNASNLAKLSQDQVTKLNTLGQMAGQLAPIMAQAPEALRPALMQRFLQSQNIDPAQLGPLANGDPDMLDMVSKNMIAASAQYQQAANLENIKQGGALAVAQQEGKDRLASTQAIVGGRENVANTQASAKLALANSDQLISQISNRIGTAQEQPGDKQKVRDLMNYKQAVAKLDPVTSQLVFGAGNAPQGTIPGLDNVPSGATAPTQPAVPATTAPDGNALAAEMRRRGFLK
jgi:hypothetical protein